MDQLRFGLLKKLLSFKAKGVKKKFTNFDWQQVKCVAVLFEVNKPEQIELVNFFLKKIRQEKLLANALGYSQGNEEKSLQTNLPVVSLKEFGMGGKLKSKAAADFLKEKYGLLINFSEEDSPVLNYIASQADAQFIVTFGEKKRPEFYHLQFTRQKHKEPAQCIEQLLNTLQKIKVEC